MKLLEYRPTLLLPSADDRATIREPYAGTATLDGVTRSETRDATDNAHGSTTSGELTREL